MAKACGAHRVINVHEQGMEPLREGAPYDSIIDCSGAPSLLQQIHEMRLLAYKGVIGLVAVRSQTEFPWAMLHGTEASIEVSCHFSLDDLRVLLYFVLRGVTVGGLICNDLWANPACTPMPDTHLTQQLAGMGAKVIFHAVNGGRDGSEWSRVAWRYHESNLRLRALAGRVWIVTVDSCYPSHLRCSSPSGVVSPEGKWKKRVAAQGEQLFTFTLPVD